MKKIAIVFYATKDMYNKYGDDYTELALPYHITEWTEVTDKEFDELYGFGQLWYDRTGYSKFKIIIYPDQPKTIKDILEFSKQEKLAFEKAKEDAEKKRALAKLKKLAKAEAEEKKMLEALLAKYGSKIENMDPKEKVKFEILLSKYAK